MDKNAQSILEFQSKRLTTTLFKNFLSILEELKDDNVISNEYYERLRARILSQGNDNIREFNDFLTKFEIDFKR